MESDGKSIVVSTTITAPVEWVFDAWSTADGWNSWFTTRAQLNCVVGGRYRDADNDEGEFAKIQKPNREADGWLCFTWEHPDHCPGSLVEVRFAEAAGNATRVELFHRNLPDEAGQADMREGWSWALASCKSWFETGQTISFEDWRAEQARS